MQDPQPESGSEIIWKVGSGSKSFRIHNTDGNYGTVFRQRFDAHPDPDPTFYVDADPDLAPDQVKFQISRVLYIKAKPQEVFYHSLAFETIFELSYDIGTVPYPYLM